MKTKGFTLIELLVVIAIIGVLATMITSSFSSVRVKAQDAKRLSVANQFENALEMYYLDYGYYPQFTYAHNVNNPTGLDAFEAGIVDYINIDFSDPVFGDYPNTQVRYASTSANNYQSYGMLFVLVDPNNDNLEQNDGGRYSWAYEIGERPTYCQEKYGSNSAWWVGATVCTEGN